MKKKFIIGLICGGMLLSACGRTQTSVPDSQGNQSIEATPKTSTKMIPADEVHKIDNYTSSKGILDDDGIYRYDFLDEDDSVYEAMSYQEVEHILPVHSQKKINVTLGTNFSIDSNYFNLPTTWREIYEQIFDQELELHRTEIMTTLSNGEQKSNNYYFTSFDNPSLKTAYVIYSAINTGKRNINHVDGSIKKLSFYYLTDGRSDASVDENAGDRFSYEGINLGITRNQFLENVTINNPIYEDQYFSYDKAFDKNNSGMSISYLLDEHTENDYPSYVVFRFRNEILTEISIFATNEYLGLEVE